VMANQFCLSCVLMFVCVAVVAVAVWVEWARLQTGRERTFVAGHFYANMLKLCAVFVLVGFGGVCATLSGLPRPAKETEKYLSWAGFVHDGAEVIQRSRRERVNHLLLLYEGNCLQSYRLSRALLQPEVQELIDDYPKAMFDVGLDLYRPLLQQYRLERAPSLLIINPQREIVEQLVGEQSAEELIQAFAKLAVSADDRATTPTGR
jgi:hypothetical protein